MINLFLVAILLLSSALLAILIAAAMGRAKVQQLSAPPPAPAPAQPPAEPFVPYALTRRHIQMRIDRVQGALTLSKIRTPTVVNSLDGFTFFVTGQDAGRIVRSVRNEIELCVGDYNITVVPVTAWQPQ